jgi:AraC-like DNA-binding protein
MAASTWSGAGVACSSLAQIPVHGPAASRPAGPSSACGCDPGSAEPFSVCRRASCATSRAEAVDVWGRAGSELAERVGEESDPQGRRAMLASALTKRLAAAGRTDSLVLAASRRLGVPGSRVTELADALGISDRQLRRRFHEAVGYGPKTLDRILRFQRFVARIRAVDSGDEDLARIAADLGYADQAHLSRDSVRLAGLTPRELVESWTS